LWPVLIVTDTRNKKKKNLDYKAIDIFVNKRVRAITECPPHTSATLLRCELGIIPSEFAAHRRQLQFWYHIHSEAWFWDGLGTLVGTGPYKRLKATVIKYGMPTLDDGPIASWAFTNDKGKQEQYNKESWRRQAYKRITWEAVHHLASAAQAKKYPAPVGTTKFSKSGTLQIEPRKYVTLGGNLAKYGLQYRQALFQGQQTPWTGKNTRHIGKCSFCAAPLGDLVHVIAACTETPQDFRDARDALLQDIATDKCVAMEKFRDLDWKGIDEKEMRRALILVKMASRLVSFS
jgi:hypothetical protein